MTPCSLVGVYHRYGGICCLHLQDVLERGGRVLVTTDCNLNKGSMKCLRSRDSAVGIATGYGLHDRGVGVRVPVGSRIFTSPFVQTGSWVHPTAYRMGIGGSFPGVKRQGHETDQSPPTSAEVKKMWIYTFTPPYVFMAYCLIS
jgi:hypothetical protein